MCRRTTKNLNMATPESQIIDEDKRVLYGDEDPGPNLNTENLQFVRKFVNDGQCGDTLGYSMILHGIQEANTMVLASGHLAVAGSRCF